MRDGRAVPTGRIDGKPGNRRAREQRRSGRDRSCLEARSSREKGPTDPERPQNSRGWRVEGYYEEQGRIRTLCITDANDMDLNGVSVEWMIQRIGHRAWLNLHRALTIAATALVIYHMIMLGSYILPLRRSMGLCHGPTVKSLWVQSFLSV